MIRKLAPYTKGYRVWIFLGVLCSAGEAVLELLLPKAMSQIVDVGIANGDKAYILATGLKMILMALASLVMGVGAAALAAKAGMGFGAFFSYQVLPHVAQGRLALVLEDFEHPPRPIQLVYPSARLLPARTRSFIDWMKAEFQDFAL